jgi:hypothetical protein
MRARKSPYLRFKPDYKRDLDLALLDIGLMESDVSLPSNGPSELNLLN